MSINSQNGNTLLTSGSFPPVRAASTGAPLIPETGGLLVVDGVQLVAGDRVLCKDETDQTTNGIYAASTGSWVRTTDAAGNQNFFSGMAVTVGLGSVNAGLTYICTCTDDPVIVGTSLLTFVAQAVVANATQSATSTSTVSIGTGSKSFTIQVGKAFKLGQWVLAQTPAAAFNGTTFVFGAMLGQVVGYSGTTLTLQVVATSGAPGSPSTWNIVLTSSPASAGYLPPIGSGNVTGPGLSTAGHMATFADTTGLVVQDGGVPVGGPNTITPSMFASAAVALGFNMLNGTLVATSTDSNTSLTIAVKTLAGADPSAADPVFFLFRSATQGSAGYSIVEVTAALSTKIPAGSTMGFANGLPGKVWVVAVVNNLGVVSLAVINCLIATATAASIYPLAGWGLSNVTNYGAGAGLAQVLYGVATISMAPPYSVLGYFTYEAGSTLASAGIWATAPSRMELYRPGVALPGQTVQSVFMTTTANLTTGSGAFQPTNVTNAILMSSSANLCKITTNGTFTATLNNVNAGGKLGLFRGASQVGPSMSSFAQPSGASTSLNITLTRVFIDAPQLLGSVTYMEKMLSTAGTVGYPSTDGGAMLLEEIAA